MYVSCIGRSVTLHGHLESFALPRRQCWPQLVTDSHRLAHSHHLWCSMYPVLFAGSANTRKHLKCSRSAVLLSHHRDCNWALCSYSTYWCTLSDPPRHFIVQPRRRDLGCSCLEASLPAN